MPDDPRYDPDSIRPGVPTIVTPTGRKPVGVADADAYFAKVIRSTDTETDAIGPVDDLNRYPAELASLSWPKGAPGVLTMSPRDAAMVGLYRLIRGVTWQSFDLQKVLDGDERVAITLHSFTRTDADGRDLPAIYFDWPDWAVEDMPAQAALITSPEEIAWEPSGLHARLLEETLHRFGEGTVLRYLGEISGPLEIVCICAHKDQRRGLEARLLQLFAAERHDDRFGRRAIVPEYFSREARFTLQGVTRVDGPPEAIGNRWQLTVSLLAEIEQVELLVAPGFVDSVAIDVVAS